MAIKIITHIGKIVPPVPTPLIAALTETQFSEETLMLVNTKTNNHYRVKSYNTDTRRVTCYMSAKGSHTFEWHLTEDEEKKYTCFWR